MIVDAQGVNVPWVVDHGADQVNFIRPAGDIGLDLVEHVENTLRIRELKIIVFEYQDGSGTFLLPPFIELRKFSRASFT